MKLMESLIRQIVGLFDNVAWVSQGLNFVHKKKEIGGACSKLWGKKYTGFGGQT